MSMSNDVVLRVSDLNVFYKNRKRKLFSKKKKIQALFDVNLTMEEGEVLAIAGESGSGKSTLARAIVGINKDYTGEIWQKYENPQMVFQDPYSSLNPAKKIGWLLEEPLKVDKKRDYSLYLKIEDFLNKDWDAVEKRHVFSILLYDENGEQIKGKWFKGEQKDAPYFNCDLVNELKVWFNK